MKTLLSTLAVLTCVSAQAMPALSEVKSAIQSALAFDCNNLTNAVLTVSKISDEQRYNILYNLSYYKYQLDHAAFNLHHKRDASGYLNDLKVRLDARANQTYSGPYSLGIEVPTGKFVYGCVKPKLSFNFNGLNNVQKEEHINTAVQTILGMGNQLGVDLNKVNYYILEKNAQKGKK